MCVCVCDCLSAVTEQCAQSACTWGAFPAAAQLIDVPIKGALGGGYGELP